MTLTELFKDIADAIREKKGTTESIVAEDFPEEIESIETGSSVTYYPSSMQNLFLNNTDITSLDLSAFDTRNTTTVRYMFKGCSSLVSVDISHFDLSNCTSFSSNQDMIIDCTSLDNNSLNSIMKALSTTSQTSNITLKYAGFTREQAERSITLSNWSLLQAKGWTTGY